MIFKPRIERFGWRLMAAFVLVSIVSAGVLGLTLFFATKAYRLDRFRDRSLEQAELNLAVARSRLERDPSRQQVDALFALYRRNGDFDTVILPRREPYIASDASLGKVNVPPALQRSVEEPGVHTTSTQVGRTDYFVVGGPLNGKTDVFYFFSQEEVDRGLRVFQQLVAIGSLVAGILGALVGLWLARRVLAPVAKASAAARSLAEGLLETRLPVTTHDEFGIWAQSFNTMARALQDKIEALSQATQREKQFTADVSHELRTPVTALLAEASLLDSDTGGMPPEARRAVSLVVADLARLGDLVDELLEIARFDAGKEVPRVERVDIDSLITKLVRHHGWESDVEVDSRPVTIGTDPRRVDRIVANLIENARRHGGDHVAVTVASDKGNAIVTVSDNGIGIPPDRLARIFDRFYKEDDSRSQSGTGLGLAIALENARLLQGKMDVYSSVGEGTRFTVTLPNLEGHAPLAAPSSAHPAPNRSAGRDLNFDARTGSQRPERFG